MLDYSVQRPAFSVLLFSYTAILAAATLFLLMAGGLVTSTGSALSVPDWPTTYGQNMFTFPPSKWVGGIFYEHGHRLVASSVGFLTIGLFFLLLRYERRRWLKILGTVALAGVIVQGVLGGMTVKYLLPTPVSVAHAGTAQLFFCTILSIALFLSRGWHVARPWGENRRDLRLRRLCLAATAVIYVQVLLGAVARHTQSGLAIPDFPLNYGRLVPPLDGTSIDAINHGRRWGEWGDWLPEVTARQVLIHYLHRVNALLASVLIVAAAVRAIRSRDGWLRNPACLMLLLLPLQIMLGAYTVWTRRDVATNTAHVVTGAALLGTSLVLTLRAWRRNPNSAIESESSLVLEGVPA